MTNLMPKWEFKPYFADSWVLTRDGVEVGVVYRTGKESRFRKEAFFLFGKEVPKEEFDEFLKGIGMVVNWRYDSEYKKYQSIVNRVD